MSIRIERKQPVSPGDLSFLGALIDEAEAILKERLPEAFRETGDYFPRSPSNSGHLASTPPPIGVEEPAGKDHLAQGKDN